MLTAEFGKSFMQLIETRIQGLVFFFQSISYVYVLIIAVPSLYLFLWIINQLAVVANTCNN